tara:strand:+ start:1377 stop:1736 length:360 start_codon:yes stop_codon:yes gene_type:complete
LDFRKEKFDNSLKKILGEFISTDEDFTNKSIIITIISVDTSRDFSHCKIGVSIFNDYSKKNETILEDLNKKRFLFQKIVSKNIRTSRIPKLSFFEDKSLEFHRQIDDLINKVSTENKEI